MAVGFGGGGFQSTQGSAPTFSQALGQAGFSNAAASTSGGGGGGGGGSSSARAAREAARIAAEKAAAERLAAEKKAKAEAAARAKAELEIKQQQTAFAKFKEQQTAQETQTAKFAAYDPRFGGVITSTGQVYPTRNQAFIPGGFEQGQGYSVQGGVAVGTTKPKPVSTTTNNQAYLEQKQIDTFRAPDGKKIPINALYYVNPATGEYRRATPEEEKYYRSQPKELVASTKKVYPRLANIKQDISLGYQRLNTGMREYLTAPIEGGIIKTTGKTPQQLIEKGVEYNVLGVPFLPSPLKELESTAFKAVYEDIRYNPASYALSYGAGKAVGFGIKATQIGISSIKGFRSIKVVGTTIKVGAPAVRVGLRTTGVVAGLGFGAYTVGTTYLSLKDLPKQEIVSELSKATSRGIAFGIGSVAGTKSATYNLQQITIRTPLRKLKVPTFEELQKTVIINGKEVRQTALVIRGEDIPPIKKIVTTQRRLDAGLEPLRISLQGPRKFIVKPVGGPIIDNKPYLAARYTIGISSKVYKSISFGEVSGGSEYFKPRLDLGSLSKTERYTLGKFLQRQTGRPAPKNLKELANLFARDTEMSRTQIRFYEYGKIKPSQKIFKPKTPGKKTTLSQAISKEKLIKETEDVETFSSISEFKDISKPFARASGKTTPLRGIVVRYKEPIFLDTKATPVYGKSYFKGTSTPLSKTFGSQITEQKQIIPVAKPQIKLKTFKQTTTSPGLKDSFSLPSSTFKTLYSLSSTEKEVSGIKPIELIRSLPSQISIPLIKNVPKEKSINKNIVKEKNVLQEKPQLKQKLTQKQQPKLQLKLLLKEKIKAPPVTTGGFKLRIKTTPKIFRGYKTLYKQPTSTGRFSVFLRRRGQFKQVGTATSLSQAFGIGTEKARSTLGRTFKVQGTDRAFKTPKGFYTKKSKKGETLFIQKARYSLGTFGEKAEIKKARRNKKR